MLTKAGMNLLLERSFVSVPTKSVPIKFKVGINQATPTEIDSDLTYPTPIQNAVIVDPCETAGNWLATTDGAISLNNTTFKENTGALNLYKTGTTQASVTYYANNKMVSSTITNKELYIWLYIKDDATLNKLTATNCLEIRYGIDYNTNYYYKRWDKTGLATGWNILKLNLATCSTTGTPGAINIDSGAVVLTFINATQTIAAGDIIIDDWKLVSPENYFKNFESGYPTLNYTDNEVTFRGYLNSMNANGYNLTGFGIFNSDATPLLSNIHLTEAISKTDTDEVAYIVKMRITKR